MAPRPRLRTRAVAPRSSGSRFPTLAVLTASLIPSEGAVADTPGLVRFTVEATLSHDASCDTEGLFVLGDEEPEIFESCGLPNVSSSVKAYSPTTGDVRLSVQDKGIFGEGIAALGSTLYVLNSLRREVLEYELTTGTFTRSQPLFLGEGFGLTTDGCDLLVTTGTAHIHRLRPDDTGALVVVGTVLVTDKGAPVEDLSELEYVTPKLWINQRRTNIIWRVDPLTGECESRLDVSGLHSWRGDSTPNGIAYSPLIGQTSLLVTGKFWQHMYVLRLPEVDLCGGAPKSVPTCLRAPPSACWRPVPAAGIARMISAPDVVGALDEADERFTDVARRLSDDEYSTPGAGEEGQTSRAPPLRGALRSQQPVPIADPAAEEYSEPLPVTVVGISVAAVFAMGVLAAPWWICAPPSKDDGRSRGVFSGRME